MRYRSAISSAPRFAKKKILQLFGLQLRVRFLPAALLAVLRTALDLVGCRGLAHAMRQERQMAVSGGQGQGVVYAGP
jgi:hypothetical protein